MDHTPIRGTVNSFPTGNKQRAAKSERTPFLMLFGDDFLSGCRKAAMSPEQVGMYIYMLILEWTDKAPIDDDMKRLAVRCGWDVRLVKRLVNEVVGLAKYNRENGQLSNERMQREINIYIAKVQAKGERKAATSRGDVPQLLPSSLTATPQLSHSYPTAKTDLSENLKENNECASKNASYTRARNIQIQKHIEKEVASQPVDGGVLAGLNGSAYPMIEAIKAWVTLDDVGARKWLTGTIQHYGEQPTKDAFQKLTTDIAEGKLISRPLQVWSTIARDYANGGRRTAPSRESDDKRKAVLQAQRDKIRKEFGWLEEATTNG